MSPNVEMVGLDLRGTLVPEPIYAFVFILPVVYFMFSFMAESGESRVTHKPKNWGLIVGVYVIISSAVAVGMYFSALATGVWLLLPAIIILASFSVFFLFVLFMILAFRSGKKRAG
jgi:hypothetical protein